MSGSEPASPARILVVDDERDNRELLAIILTWEGYDVTTEASGSDALRSVERTRPSLMLLDVMMPTMNGYEVLARLRETDTPRVAVIMVTALVDANARASALRGGADGFLSKPLERSALLRCVRSVLQTAAYPAD